MEPNIKLGRFLGIEIGLHFSWLIIAALIVFSLAARFHFTNPEWSTAIVWSLAAVTAVLFFISILVHEMSHALVARRRGIAVRSITLFALGGVANMEKDSSDAKSEFWVAIAGPLTSVAIGVFFLGLAIASGWQPDAGTPASPLWAGFVWLGFINIVLAVFNMIPGYPLDGGRVLRSAIWWFTNDAVRATRIAATVGQVIAVAFIATGLFRFFAGAGIGALWIAFIGWFLSQAAGASYQEVQTSQALAGVRVKDVMSTDCAAIDARMNLRTFADEFLLRTGRRCFVVAQDGRETGLVTIQQMRQVPQNRWPFTTVADITVPLENVRTLSPDSDVKEALEVMARENINQLPVVFNGKLVGVISRVDVLQLLQTQAELRAA
jgi:Zn-dependent protease/CBS domain-containing protein